MKGIMNENISSSPTIISADPNRVLKDVEKMNAKEQKKIEQYNDLDIFKYEEDLSGKTWVDTNILVRLFKLDYIKKTESEILGNFATRKKRWIEVETRSGIEQTQIEDPLPYMMVGVVCRTGKNTDLSFVIGNIVEISGQFDLQNSMYYPNKEEIDNPMSKDDVLSGLHPYPLHTGYFKISPFLVEAVIE